MFHFPELVNVAWSNVQLKVSGALNGNLISKLRSSSIWAGIKLNVAFYYYNMPASRNCTYEDLQFFIEVVEEKQILKTRKKDFITNACFIALTIKITIKPHFPLMGLQPITNMLQKRY